MAQTGGKTVAGETVAGKTVARKTVSGKSIAGESVPGKTFKRSALPAKRCSGAPAPLVPLGFTAATIGSTAPAPHLPVVPYTTGIFSEPIRIAGKEWEVIGRGKLNPAMNGSGDGYCFVCRDGDQIMLCTAHPACQAGVCIPWLQNPPPEILALPFICPD
ncbi:hypothetical protein B0H14DRAFT_2578864 [Mycena olivaceomarginata]|nr:hypothetical protein B0H14DRAFT_2578864 [Mycena olivaceomarginata]